MIISQSFAYLAPSKIRQTQYCMPKHNNGHSPCFAARKLPSATIEDHPGVMENVIDKMTIGSEAGVVPVFDIVARQFVSAFIGAFMRATRFHIMAIGKEFVSDVSVLRLPKANIGVVDQRFGFRLDGGLRQNRCGSQTD